MEWIAGEAIVDLLQDRGKQSVLLFTFGSSMVPLEIPVERTEVLLLGSAITGWDCSRPGCSGSAGFEAHPTIKITAMPTYSKLYLIMSIIVLGQETIHETVYETRFIITCYT
jgi:hypothetical protein